MLNLNKKQKRIANRIIISLFFFVVFLIFFRFIYQVDINNQLIAKLLPIFVWLSLYIFVGFDLIKKGIKNLINKQLLGEDLLMLIASMGALALPHHQYKSRCL